MCHGVQAVRLLAGGAGRPHPAKEDRGGEDAWFVSRANGGAAGVADGVGGWAGCGVDVRTFSRKLMRLTARAAEAGHAGGTLSVLAAAHAGVVDIPGSATCIVALIQPSGILEVACLGDSGIRVLRDDQCVFASQAQQHAFNMPYQLASARLLPEANGVEDADVYELEVAPGDVVVLGSDGVFDNLWDEQLAALVACHCQDMPERSQRGAEVLAQAIVEAASENANSGSFRSPWVVEAARAGALPFWARLLPRGGKLDDITAVVGFVVGSRAAATVAHAPAAASAAHAPE